MKIDFSAHCTIPNGDPTNWIRSLTPDELYAHALNATHMRATREACPTLPITKAEIAELALTARGEG
jgi:hypothetical protein